VGDIKKIEKINLLTVVKGSGFFAYQATKIEIY